MTALTKGEARNEVENVKDNGLEAWRQLILLYDPRTTFNRQVIYDKLIDPKRAPDVMDIREIVAG